MNWTVWDIVIIAVVGLQLGAVGFLVYAALQLKNGAVAGILGKFGGVARSSNTLVAAGSGAITRNQTRVRGVLTSVRRITDAVRRDRFVPDGLTINYQTLLTAFAMLRTFRGYQRQLSSLLGRGQTPPPGPTAVAGKARPRVRRSLPDRLGLIPPAARHLSRAVPVARFLFGVWKELKKRGLRV